MAAASAPAAVAGTAAGAAATRPPNALAVGTIVWLASELMFFAGLFAAWFGLRNGGPGPWPPEGVELDAVRTGVATAVLVASSFALHRADRAADAGRDRLAVRWVLVTVALGAIFLANQALEYAGLDFSISSHAYGTIFFLLTGFHGLHVLGGLGIFAAVLGVCAGRSARAPLAPALTAASYYWHFVDVVWVAMFATIYLIG